MIQSFSIENFKSFRKATLPLSPLTLLIGANASGKSNAIEAIQLLSWLAWGRSLNDLLYDVREQELSLRGGFKDLGGARGDISLGCEMTGNPDQPPLISLSIALKVTEAGLHLTRERLLLGRTPYMTRKMTPKALGQQAIYTAWRFCGYQRCTMKLRAVFRARGFSLLHILPRSRSTANA